MPVLLTNYFTYTKKLKNEASTSRIIETDIDLPSLRYRPILGIVDEIVLRFAEAE